MNNIEVVTFATHNEGFFDKLINNNFNVKVKVLGFGKKWSGFNMKSKYYLEYLQQKNDDDIIVLIDGFDTIINKNLENCYENFLKMNCKVLMSKHTFPFYLPYFIKKKFFSNCYDNNIANCGLYMGYCKYLKILLKESLKSKCKDDQVVINKLCKNYDFIKVDVNNAIFKNLTNYEFKNLKKEKLNSIFLQVPGSLNYNRIKRGFKEYPQFIMKEINVFFIIISLILLFYRKYLFIIILLIIYIIFFCSIEKSCL